MSLAILFHFLCAQHVSDINISIIRSLRLFCWITILVVLFLVRWVLEFRCGWVGVVSVVQAEASLIVFFNVKVSLFSDFLTPLCLFSWSWWFICSLLFFISFVYFFFSYFLLEEFRMYFGCYLTSYDLIFLSLWLCILIVLSRDRLCGLVVRVSGYRYRGPGFDPRR